MASEKAKELAAKQKAELKAAKLAKKNSTNPRDWGWFRQVRETYRVTVESDPASQNLIIGAGVGVAVLVGQVGIFLPPWWMWIITGLMAGLVAALYMLLNRAKKATYKRYAGKPGSAEVAFGMLDKKKFDYTPASPPPSSWTWCTACSARPALCWSARVRLPGSRRCWPVRPASTSRSPTASRSPRC